MKKIKILLGGMIMLFCLIAIAILVQPKVLNAADNIIGRLKGKILLQVESRGEAWYVNPTDGKRYFIGTPAEFMKVIKKLGLGISDADLNKIPMGDIDNFGKSVKKQYYIKLDANNNFINFAINSAKYLDLPQGTYTINLDSTFNYALGYDFAYGNKVVLSAVTNGISNGHVWVVEKGQPFTIDLYDYHNPSTNIRLWAFFPELGPAKDNTGSATIHVLSNSTQNESVMNLDANDNFINLASKSAKFIELPQGLYNVTLDTNFNYALGYDFAYNNKVVLSAVTNGLPNGHVWVVEKGQPLTIDLHDNLSPNAKIKLWAFFPELGSAKDNTGSATVKINKL